MQMSKSTMLTILGCVLAALTAVADFLAHMNMEGGAMKQPTFWFGLLIAAILGIKGYLVQGTPPAGQEIVMKTVPPPAA